MKNITQEEETIDLKVALFGSPDSGKTDLLS
jgi:hypothetical protein